MTIDQLENWMKEDEGEHLEFKEAKNDFDFEKLVRYCAALANEGGDELSLALIMPDPAASLGLRLSGSRENKGRTSGSASSKD